MVVSKRTVNTNYKKNLLDKLETELSSFLISNPDVSFYACMFEVCPLSGEVCVSLNTEFDFHRKRKFYEVAGKPVDLNKLRYSTDDWNYQSIVCATPVDIELFETYYSDSLAKFSKFITQLIIEYVESSPLNSECEVIVRIGKEPLKDSRMRFEFLKRNRA